MEKGRLERSGSQRGLCGVPTHGITGAVHIQGKKEWQRKCMQGMRHLKTHKTLIWEKGMKYSVQVIAFYLCPYLFIDSELFLAFRRGLLLR